MSAQKRAVASTARTPLLAGVDGDGDGDVGGERANASSSRNNDAQTDTTTTTATTTEQDRNEDTLEIVQTDRQRRGDDDAEEEASLPPLPRRHSTITIPSALSVCFSIVSIAFLTAAYSRDQYFRPSFEDSYLAWDWAVREAGNGMVGVSLLLLIIGTANLARLRISNTPLPPVLIFVVFPFVFFFLLGVTWEGLVGWDGPSEHWDPRAKCYGNWHYPPADDDGDEAGEGEFASRWGRGNAGWRAEPDPKCFDFARGELVLFGVAVGSAVGNVVLVAYLWVVTAIAIYRLRVWRQAIWRNGNFLGLRVPTGQLTFEFTIKVLGREELRQQRERQGGESTVATQEAGGSV